MERRAVLLVVSGTAVAAGVGVVVARRVRGGGLGGRGSSSASSEPLPTYTCECGAAYRFSGAGRHRVFWAADAPESQPVLEDHCPACGRAWPEEASRDGASLGVA